MAGKREPPGDPLEVSWMGGFTGMDGDTPPALSSAASTSEPQVLPPGERSHGWGQGSEKGTQWHCRGSHQSRLRSKQTLESTSQNQGLFWTTKRFCGHPGPQWRCWGFSGEPSGMLWVGLEPDSTELQLLGSIPWSAPHSGGLCPLELDLRHCGPGEGWPRAREVSEGWFIFSHMVKGMFPPLTLVRRNALLRFKNLCLKKGTVSWHFCLSILFLGVQPK